MKEKETIEYLDLKSLVPFRNHPFKLRNGEEKEQLLKSIKAQGTIEPLIVRPLSESEYEVISGHRRMEICRELGIEKLPVIVRNLTDEQFKALCQIGGTAGLNLYGAFLKDEGPVTLEDVWQHIEHFLELGGEGHIALGGDLDGCSVLPESFTGVDSYELLAQWLEEKHLPAATIEHIFSESLLKVVKQCTM